MFFMFHILIFTIHIGSINSAPRRTKTLDRSYAKGNVEISRFKDGFPNNASDFRTHKPMLQILRNFTRIPANNLKSNIFDKMLSEEMFSLKQKFFEKDLIHSSTAKKVKQGNAPTPTIEVQQKWSVVELFTKPDIDEVGTKGEHEETVEESKSDNSVDSNFMLDDIKNSRNISKNKILELRSLPARDDRQHRHATSKCSCTRPFPQRNHCTQASTDSSVSISYTLYPMYLPYQTYFFSDNQENSYENTYYHPKVVDDTKVPKKTKRRKTTPYAEDDLYYDENNKVIDDDEDDVPRPRRPKHRRPNIIMNIDYDIVNNNDNKPNLLKGHAENNHLIEDLNEIYKEGVQKKCFCSGSAHKMPERIFLYIFLILLLYEYCQ